MGKRFPLLIALAVSGCTRPLTAPSNTLYPVEVSRQSSDGVGHDLVHEIRKEIRESSSLVETDSGGRPGMIVNTFEPDKGGEPDGTRSIYNVIWLARDADGGSAVYRASTMGVCSRDRTESIATTLVDATGSL